MSKNKFEQEFPNVPAQFHNRVENTLDKIETVTNMKLSRKRIAIFAFVAVLAFGSITVMAAGAFQWNQKLAQIFGVDKPQQNNLVEKGATYQNSTSITDNGLTISLVQVLQDKSRIYILFEVTAQKDIKISDKNLFEVSSIDVSGKEFNVTADHGFLSLVDEPEITNKRYYRYMINKKYNEADLNGKDITVHFKNLQVESGKLNMNTILEGDWALTWKMSYQDSTKYLDLNKISNLSGNDVLVKRVEISPLGMTVYLDGQDVKAIIEKRGLGKADNLNELEFKGVRYKDGAVLPIIGNGGGEWLNKDTGEYELTVSFDKIINVENVKELLFGASNSEIDLSK